MLSKTKKNIIKEGLKEKSVHHLTLLWLYFIKITGETSKNISNHTESGHLQMFNYDNFIIDH